MPIMGKSPVPFRHTVSDIPPGGHRVTVPVPHWIFWGRGIRAVWTPDTIDSDRASTFTAFGVFSRTRGGETPQYEDLTAEHIAKIGDSYFVSSLPSSEIEVRAKSISLKINLITNEERRLAGFESAPMQDITIQQAVLRVREAINVLTVTLTSSCNVPFIVESIHVISEDRLQGASEVRAAYPVIQIDYLHSVSVPALEPVKALYSEALQSWSPFYRFLCFFKIVDKILTQNGRHQELAQKYNVTLSPLGGTLTTDEPFRSLASEYVGRKYSFIRDSLQTLYRNEIAHLDLGSPVRSFDSQAEIEVGTNAMLLTYIAHDLIKQLEANVKLLLAAGAPLDEKFAI
jgi:hypothetical protein